MRLEDLPLQARQQVQAELSAVWDMKRALEVRVTDLETALAWVRDELSSPDAPDAPDHAHEKRGVWDGTGKPCEECARWKKVWALVGHIEPEIDQPSTEEP